MLKESFLFKCNIGSEQCEFAIQLVFNQGCQTKTNKQSNYLQVFHRITITRFSEKPSSHNLNFEDISHLNSSVSVVDFD